MWLLLLNLVLALLVGGVSWFRGYRQGKREARQAHAACHEAERVMRAKFLQAVSEHADVQAWEEEL